MIGHSKTMTLVRVKETNNIFGAYVACEWPKLTADMAGLAYDPSGTSFLFSLTNAHHRPLRFRLSDPTKMAVKTYAQTGPMFGNDGGGGSAVGCMKNGRPADALNGCWDRGMQGRNFELDLACEAKAGLPKPGFDPHATGFLSGSAVRAGVDFVDFGCEEFEVWVF